MSKIYAAVYYLSLVIPRIQRWGAKHAVLLLMKLSALRPYHTMTAGRGGAGTTRHEIRGGKNWLAIFICAKLNKRRLLPSSAYYQGVGSEWSVGVLLTKCFCIFFFVFFFFFFLIRGWDFFCWVREDVDEGRKGGFRDWGKKRRALEEIPMRRNRSHGEDRRKRPKKKRRVEQRGWNRDREGAKIISFILRTVDWLTFTFLNYYLPFSNFTCSLSASAHLQH